MVKSGVNHHNPIVVLSLSFMQKKVELFPISTKKNPNKCSNILYVVNRGRRGRDRMVIGFINPPQYTMD